MRRIGKAPERNPHVDLRFARAPPLPLKKTALNATHRALKAKMVDFGGWDMPVEYPCPGGGLIAEHMAVRTGVGLFDVSHMGEIQFRGPGSLAAVQHITMNDAAQARRTGRRTTPRCSRRRARLSTTSWCTGSARTTICWS